MRPASCGGRVAPGGQRPSSTAQCRHIGSRHRFYPLERATERVSPSRATPVECQHSPGRSTHRGHAQTTQVREPLLRPSFPGDRHIPGQRWPTWIIELHRATDRRRPTTLADSSRTAGGNGGDLCGAVSPDGRPDATPRTVEASEAAIAWTATLHPFADELPSGTDWVEFRTSRDPADEIQQLAQQWTRTDERNRSLEQAIPIKFVRDTLIKSANRDLVLAAAAGVSVTTDRLHSQVVAQRFNDQPGWNLQGYAIPLLFPQAGELPWEAIADLRRDRNMARFRAVLREVEEEATAEAAGGNVKEAANRAYTRHLADASGRLEGVGSSVRRTAIGIVVSGAIGAATLPIPAPWGIVVGTATGTVPTTITDVRNVIRQRRSRGWVALHQRIISGGQVAT